MDNDESETTRLSRRAVLGSLGIAGTIGLAGCSGSEDDKQPPQDDAKEPSPSAPPDQENDTVQTESVVFTDTPTSGGETESEAESTTATTRVFDGGDMTSFIESLQTAAQIDVPLQIEEGTYRFDETSAGGSGAKQPHAEFNDISGLTIEGNGSTIIFTNPERGGFWFQTGSDITIRDLTFDYDPVPFTQGKITEFSKDDGTIILHLDDEFPSLQHQMFENANTVYGLPHNPSGGFVEEKRSELSSDKHFTDIESINNREFRLSLDQRRSDFTGVAVDNRLTIVARDNQATLRFYKTQRPLVEDVTVRTANGASFIAGVCESPSFKNCTIAPPPDSDRQLASVADGIRITNCIGGSLIENCRHEQLGDDSVAIDNHMATVTEIQSRHTIAVDGVHPFAVTEGDILEAISPEGIIRGELPAVENYEARFQSVGDRNKPETITFKQPIDEILETGDYLGNTVTASAGYTIRNNEFRNHRANLIRANTKNGLIENNLLEGVDGNAIELHTGTRGAWPPTCWVSNVSVRGNEIRGAGMKYIASEEAAAIYLHHETPANTPTDGQPNQDVEIVDNEIEECASVGIEAEATEGLYIEGNSMAALNQMDYEKKGYGVDISNSREVTVTGNEVTGNSELLSGFGKARTVEQFTASENTTTIDGEQQTGDVVQFVPVTFEFNRTVIPDEGSQPLTFLCYSLALLDSEGSVIREISLGEQESGVVFGEGIDSVESADGQTWRWFGPAQKSSVLYFYKDELAQADGLRLDGWAIEEGISASISIGGEVTDSVEWTNTNREKFWVSLER